jgi:hypothetical protein
MIRLPGMNPALARWNRPGNNFRRDRSPVAPNKTTTCGNLGPTRAEFLANVPFPVSPDVTSRFRMATGVIVGRCLERATQFCCGAQ